MPLLPDNATLTRRSGLLMTWAEDNLAVWAKREQLKLELNRSAALIWFLCDGQLRVREIEERVGQRYPDAAARIESDVPEILEDLHGRGLVEITDGMQPVRPLVRVGFCNFWSGFNGQDNFFAWMLVDTFDVLLVDAQQDEADVVFYSTFPDTGFDHAQVDRTRTLKVCFSNENHPPNLDECDYAFWGQAAPAQTTDRQSDLPLWSLYVDWDAYAPAAPSFGENGLPVRYTPHNVCARLYDALFQSATQDGPEGGSDPERANKTARDSGTRAMKLTVGMATYDDYDGVYFTAQAIRLYHPEVTEETEILVVDNNPDGPCAESLQKLADWIPGYRYVANHDVRGTASRDRVFREAQAPYVMCLDSHVLLVPGALRQLIDYFDTHPDCHDLLQGPLVYDDLKSISTHFNPVWSHGMYGVWATDERGKDPHHEPFEIPMQGLGVFTCRKDAWLGFNPRFLGFGGEEGYIHEKFRQAGRRTLCLPFLRWLHRFTRPFGTQYQNIWEERIRNYLIGWTELGLDTTSLETHFQEHLGAEVFTRTQSQVQAELANPFFYFDAIYCINLDSAQDRWQAMQERFKKLGIFHRVRRFPAIETPESQHIGCALSHRRIIEQAQRQQLRNVFVFEDDTIFLEDTLTHLEKSVSELKTQAWKVFHLGGHKWGQQFPKAPGCSFLESPCASLTCSHAVAYNHSVYQRILDDVPNDTDEMKGWISTHAAIDQYLQGINQRYLSAPVVASQPPLLPQEDPVYREHFTL